LYSTTSLVGVFLRVSWAWPTQPADTVAAPANDLDPTRYEVFYYEKFSFTAHMGRDHRKDKFLSNLKARMNFKKIKNVIRPYVYLQPYPIIPKTGV